MEASVFWGICVLSVRDPIKTFIHEMPTSRDIFAELWFALTEMFLKSYAAECVSTFQVAIGKTCFATEMSSCRPKHEILKVVFILYSFSVDAATALHALVLWSPDFLHVSVVCPNSISQFWGCKRLTRVSIALASSQD